ncbi:hypothetical protein [Paenisporosarcina sp. NPDC076898]|uniref:hypothetical protein n=1 Tax=unclassified Paenisporosarcina TaxID=2642018 RepID=UPI003D0453A7
MKRRILIVFLAISVVGLIFSVYDLLHESKAKALSVAFIEETYQCENDMRAIIYGKDDEYYAVSVRSNDDLSKSFYLKIRLSMWFQLEEILDATEYNEAFSCEED